MEFKSAEEKLLHDYGVLEDENARLEYDNGVLQKRIETLEKRVSDLGEQAQRLIAERDQARACIDAMMGAAYDCGYGER